MQTRKLVNIIISIAFLVAALIWFNTVNRVSSAIFAVIAVIYAFIAFRSSKEE